MILKTFAAVSALVLGLSAVSANDSFPSRPVRVIDAYAAGGSSDLAMRILAEAFGRALGQSVIIESKPAPAG